MIENLDKTYTLKYLVAIFVLLAFAFALAILAMETESVEIHKEKTIDLSNGISSPIFEIFEYKPEDAYVAANLTITSYCQNNINISLIFFYFNGDDVLTNGTNTVLGYNETVVMKLNNMHASVFIDKYNCCINLALDTKYNVQKYGYLSIPAFIFSAMAMILIIKLIHIIVIQKTIEYHNP